MWFGFCRENIQSFITFGMFSHWKCSNGRNLRALKEGNVSVAASLSDFSQIKANILKNAGVPRCLRYGRPSVNAKKLHFCDKPIHLEN